MTWFDLIVICVMGLSILFAAFRGISREITTLIALAVAAVLAFWIAGPIAGAMGISLSLITNLILIVVLFAFCFLLVNAGMGMLIKRSLGQQPGRIDRAIGGVFGFLRGWMIVGLAFLALDYYFEGDRRPEALDNALTGGFAMAAADILINLGLETKSSDSSITAYNLPADDTNISADPAPPETPF